jgi:hypothetical protein
MTKFWRWGRWPVGVVYLTFAWFFAAPQMVYERVPGLFVHPPPPEQPTWIGIAFAVLFGAVAALAVYEVTLAVLAFAAMYGVIRVVVDMPIPASILGGALIIAWAIIRECRKPPTP